MTSTWQQESCHLISILWESSATVIPQQQLQNTDYMVVSALVIGIRLDILGIGNKLPLRQRLITRFFVQQFPPVLKQTAVDVIDFMEHCT